MKRWLLATWIKLILVGRLAWLIVKALPAVLGMWLRELFLR